MQAPDAPQAVTPPAGSKYSMTTVGIGEITYECRAKAGAPDAFEWVFVAPVATLYDGNRKVVGKYYGGPTWEAADGSKVTGKQLAVAPKQVNWLQVQSTRFLSGNFQVVQPTKRMSQTRRERSS